MNVQLLAAINDSRHITHDAGQVVYLNWDGHQFCLERSRFNCFVRALEYGSRQLFAGDGCYSVVQVDNDVREVWIDKTCLTLNHDEFRALLNAALTTETRLHGFRVKIIEQPEELAAWIKFYRRPASIAPCWN